MEPPMALFFAALALASSQVNEQATEKPKMDAKQSWPGLAKLDALASLGEQQSDRFVIINSQAELDKFWANVVQPAHPDDDSLKPTADFSNQRIAVIKNQRHFNPIRFVRREDDASKKTVSVVVRETRSARPLRGSFYFVAIVIPKSTKSLTDGVVSMAVANSPKPTSVKQPKP
jgi:hypothetical protein